MILPNLYLKKSDEKGKAVFTSTFIAKETIVEVAPVIVMPNADRMLLDKTLLHDYIFEWGNNKDQCGMALGYIPIYNHSYNSNCEYFMDYEAETIMVKTVREIEEDEELTINYNGDWDDESEVWFKVK